MNSAHDEYIDIASITTAIKLLDAGVLTSTKDLPIKGVLPVYQDDDFEYAFAVAFEGKGYASVAVGLLESTFNLTGHTRNATAPHMRSGRESGS